MPAPVRWFYFLCGSATQLGRSLQGDCLKPLLANSFMVMAATKRKSVPDADVEKSSKKPKSSSSKAEPVSILRAEEPAFPRGGASVLTPLEHKQIQIQATRDVLFEQKTGKRHPGMESGDEENDSDEAGGELSAAKSKVPRKSQSKTKDKRSGKAYEEHGIRIESLSYKVSTGPSFQELH